MENIKSTRLDYQSFVYETNYEESPYFKALKKELDNKAVFILASNNEQQLENAKRAALYLAKKRFKVFVNFSPDNFNGKTKRITEVENKSEEYFSALATAKYIIAQTLLPIEFINRENQVVINDVILRGKALTRVISRNLNNKKSDYFVANEFRNSGLDFDAMLKKIKKGKLKSKEKASDKKELLFAVNLNSDSRGLEIFERIANTLDDEKYNVSLLIDNAYLEQYMKKLSALDGKVTVYIKKGKFLRSLGDDKKMSYLNKEFGYIENIDDIKAFLPPYIYEWEKKRLFGKAEFDTVINIGFQTFYWIWLFKSAAKEKFIFVDQNDFQSQNSETAMGNANRASVADKVYFLTCENKQTALSLTDKLNEKAALLPVVPLKKAKKTELQTFETNEKKRLITNIAANGIFDSLSLKSVPYFDEKGADCIYTDNTIPAQDMMQFVKNTADCNDKPIFVIDIYGILANLDINSLTSVYNVTYIQSSDVYSPLLSRFNTCFLPAENKAIQYEAQLNGINTVIIDSNKNKHPLSKIKKEFTLNIEL